MFNDVQRPLQTIILALWFANRPATFGQYLKPAGVKVFPKKAAATGPGPPLAREREQMGSGKNGGCFQYNSLFSVPGKILKPYTYATSAIRHHLIPAAFVFQQL